MAGPLEIVHVIAPGMVGGMESVVRNLAIGHQRRGHRVHVVGVVEPSPQEHPYLRAIREVGVQVHAVLVPARGYLKERRFVRRALQAIRPDVVHTHGYRPDILDGPLARRLGIPTITTLHGSSFLGGASALHEWLQLRLLKRFDAVVAVSRKLAADLERVGVSRERIHCIPNGWVSTFEPLGREAARRELGLIPDAVVVGWVGRLIPIKGCDVFLRAFGRCRAPVCAAIIGEGPERAKLEALTAELGLSRQVRFCGARAEAGRFFSAFDVFVISSRSEGAPITLLEAIASRIPVVTTAVGGVPDIVSPREALLVPAENPEALGAAIRQALQDRAAANVRSESASGRLADEFGAERWLASHEALYRSVRPCFRVT